MWLKVDGAGVPIKMKHLEAEENWLSNKYGKRAIKIWQGQMSTERPGNNNSDGQFKLGENMNLLYSYEKTDPAG
jgi:hypothetical protein